MVNGVKVFVLQIDLLCLATRKLRELSGLFAEESQIRGRAGGLREESTRTVLGTGKWPELRTRKRKISWRETVLELAIETLLADCARFSQFEQDAV